METQEVERETAELQRQQEIIKLVMVIIQLAVLGWFMIPDSVKKLWLMRSAEASRKLLSSLALRSGRACMGTELTTGQQEYTVPLILSRMRDKAMAIYEKIRSS